jgi:hypothetical protein
MADQLETNAGETSAQASGGEDMHLHRPKPLHGLREILTEVGVIVIGILIALVLEQLVEGAREQRHASEARESVRAEIAENLGLLEARRATEPCVSRRLDEVDGLIRQARLGRPPAAADVWIGHPVLWSLPESQYRSASQAGHVSLLAVHEQAGYAAIYSAFDQYNQAGVAESRAWADLRTLEHDMPTSDVADWQLRSALQQARTARWTLEISAHAAENEAASLGLKAARAPEFRLQSVCIDLHTPRTEAMRLVVEGRRTKANYDEP